MPEQMTYLSWLSSDAQAALGPVIVKAKRVWERPRHRYFTDHSVTHSERVLEKLGQLARLLSEPLNVTEERCRRRSLPARHRISTRGTSTPTPTKQDVSTTNSAIGGLWAPLGATLRTSGHLSG